MECRNCSVGFFVVVYLIKKTLVHVFIKVVLYNKVNITFKVKKNSIVVVQ